MDFVDVEKTEKNIRKLMNKHNNNDNDDRYNEYSDFNYKMKTVKFINKKRDDDMTFNPPKRTSKFYQICSYKNPSTNKFDVRVIIFNELAETVDIKYYRLSTRECKSITKNHNVNEYRLYQTYDIELVGLPETDDLLRVNSTLLN